MKSQQESFVIEFLKGWPFPVFVSSLLGFSVLFFAILAFLPPSSSPLGEFIRDFQIWCLGYDPETGSWEWGYLFMFLGGPLLLMIPLFVIWKEPLMEIPEKKKVIPYVLAAFFLVSGILGSLVFFYGSSSASQKIGEDVWKNFRVKLEPHPFTLLNQEGEKVSLEDFRGKVVLLSAVYATCGYT